MTWLKNKKIIIYSLMVAVLLTATFQPQETIGNIDNQNDYEETVLDGTGMTVPPTEMTFETNSVIYNYSDVGTWSDTGSAYDVIVDIDEPETYAHAFIADGTNGLRILDILDRTTPTEIGQYKNGSAILRGICRNGDYLYLAYGTNGFIVVNIKLSLTTPVFEKKITSVFGGATCYNIDVEGNWTYVAAGTYGMAIFNTTDKSNPIYKGRFVKTDNYGVSTVDIRDVDVYINFAYLADFKYGVRRVDITSSKTNPIESGAGYNSGSSSGIYIRNDYYACVADNSGFLLLSLYSYPTFTKTYGYSDGTHALGVYSDLDTVFVTYSNDIGMRMFNISDKLDPHYIGKYNDLDGGDGRNIMVYKDYAYIADGTDGLNIVLLDSDEDTLYDGYEIYDVMSDPFDNDTDDDTLKDGEEFYGYHAPDNQYADDTNDYFYELNPISNDTDSDTIRDDEEIYLGVDNYRTDPENNDSDSDFLADNLEISVYFTNPTKADTDSDGILDGTEIFTYGTNPLLKDTDADGIPDLPEITYKLDPLVNDSDTDYDSDGLTNLYEYSISKTRPDVNDTDTDGLTDGEEVLGIYWPTNPYSNGTGYIRTNKPLTPDADGDGLKDGEEVKIYDTNPLDADCDDDGLNDRLEVIVHHTNPSNPDTDGDLMNDYWEVTYNTDPLVDDTDVDYDNDGLTTYEEYLLNTNPKVKDTDGDGMWDGWEVENGLNPTNSNDGINDPDHDELTNVMEFNNNTDPHDTDTDDDGMGDKWEVDHDTDPLVADNTEDYDNDDLVNIDEMIAETDPWDPDTDREGLTDGEEVHIYGTNPTMRDTDLDGYSDYEEIQYGTDPLDPKSNPKQKDLTLYLSIGLSAAAGILILVVGFLTFYWVSRPEQKLFRYINSKKKEGLDSITIKDAMTSLNKALNKGEIKQIVNEFSDAKGLYIDENRIWFTNDLRIKKNIEDYNDFVDKTEVNTTEIKGLADTIKAIEHDISICEKLGFKKLKTQLEEILAKLK
ncbi:MAG TPA: hypothetical protein VMZ29_04065 [Candidatus Bathyarchaeia archaeon]|nr:hypothetical protein [Candidatus Bathyarchaeia archaeon]